jgi:choline dehydrogenase-like flavoprotein
MNYEGAFAIRIPGKAMIMATAKKPQETDFTRDVLGRYICNGLDEALNSMNKNSQRPDGSPQNDARPFDIIVIGGGSFGPVFAQHLFFQDKTRSHRILVLEAGPLVLSEHVQNLPVLGLNPPPPTETDPGVPRAEIWGLPWASDVKYGFPGLAYCIGGRSVFFGGWSPQLLDTPTDTEMPTDKWPQEVVDDLNNRYFAEAAAQIGTDESNDFIDGPMHRALRQQLFDGINAGDVSEAIPLADLPLHVKVKPGTSKAMKDQLKLEAPLAVQSQTVSGLFPFNKFSAIPLLFKTARTASFDSTVGTPFPDDVKKRFMIVPHCRVIKLVTAVEGGMGRVTEVQTTLGNVPVGPNTKVVVGLGTIESTRLALLSFQGIANYDQLGKNLMAHLRSNLTIRIPRTSLASLSPTVKDLQASALFVKGRHTHTDGSVGHFHLQITAAGLDKPGTDSEAELFKKIPDVDTFDAMRKANDNLVVITIRGIGETEARNPNSIIRLATERPVDEVGVHRAFVTYQLNTHDMALWEAMDQASDEVAKVFAGGNNFEVLTSSGMVAATPATDLSQVVPYTDLALGGRRDGMGTTHHEAGPLSMGDDLNNSVTNSDGRFHFVSNAYVAGPALFPTVGSPNPMLTGVALARRLADHLVVPPFAPEPGFTMLFNGADTSNWRMSKIKNQPGRDNPGTFLVVDGTLESVPGTDLGLFWCIEPTPPNFILKLEFLRWRDDDNSGVFLRFPDPNSKGYDNTAYVAINFGFEVQIDEVGQGNPPGQGIHKTAALYSFAAPQNPNVRPPGEWNEFVIQAQGQKYTVFLNGDKVTEYDNPDPNRGTETPSYIGLQTHTGRVAFRKIQIKAL